MGQWLRQQPLPLHPGLPPCLPAYPPALTCISCPCLPHSSATTMPTHTPTISASPFRPPQFHYTYAARIRWAANASLAWQFEKRLWTRQAVMQEVGAGPSLLACVSK